MTMSSSSDSNQLPPEADVFVLVVKLLDKAGKDPRLTIRILREKAESRLQLKKGSLKPLRPKIKDCVVKWWMVQEEEARHCLKMMVRLSKASGNTSALLGLQGMIATEQINAIRNRCVKINISGIPYHRVVSNPTTTRQCNHVLQHNECMSPLIYCRFNIFVVYLSFSD